jgi:hypothetical protein
MHVPYDAFALTPAPNFVKLVVFAGIDCGLTLAYIVLF